MKLIIGILSVVIKARISCTYFESIPARRQLSRSFLRLVRTIESLAQLRSPLEVFMLSSSILGRLWSSSQISEIMLSLRLAWCRSLLPFPHLLLVGDTSLSSSSPMKNPLFSHSFVMSDIPLRRCRDSSWLKFSMTRTSQCSSTRRLRRSPRSSCRDRIDVDSVEQNESLWLVNCGQFERLSSSRGVSSLVDLFMVEGASEISASDIFTKNNVRVLVLFHRLLSSFPERSFFRRNKMILPTRFEECSYYQFLDISITATL